MEFDTYTFTIGAHFLTALFNADETGLDDTDSELLDQFIDTLPKSGHWSTDDTDSFDFARCDVTDLISACVVCQYHVPVTA